MNMNIFWAIAIVVFGVLEGVTAQLVSIWFVLGGIAALIAALCGATVPIQIVVFVAVTIITLIITRPLVRKKINFRAEKTNADRCIGSDAVVIEEINNLEAKGQVKTDGKIWTARSSDGSIIKENEIVTVEKIDGVKLIVKTK
ncbi:MAG: NfeD family protein [Ruminococcaceae bacterium]|nr:NfeD family protein [Oscillospiraceae bacterium]